MQVPGDEQILSFFFSIFRRLLTGDFTHWTVTEEWSGPGAPTQEIQKDPPLTDAIVVFPADPCILGVSVSQRLLYLPFSH